MGRPQLHRDLQRADWHRYQILTKRAERLAELNDRLPWAPHIWQGVTVEHPDYADRIALLRETGAQVKFVSLEPLLAPMPSLNLRDIQWVIVGGESGPGARPMLAEWVIEIQAQCRTAGTAFYFKQWGGVFKKRHGRLLHGRTWDERPSESTPTTRMPQAHDWLPA